MTTEGSEKSRFLDSPSLRFGSLEMTKVAGFSTRRRFASARSK